MKLSGSRLPLLTLPWSSTIRHVVLPQWEEPNCIVTGHTILAPICEDGGGGKDGSEHLLGSLYL